MREKAMPNNRVAKQDRETMAGLDEAGLLALLEETKKKQWQDRFAKGKRQLTNTSEIANTRKRIARILTYLSQLEQKQEAKS
jgi:ribosomal protein L29